MANFAIKGHATRGKEIIKLLEMLGGKNTYKINYIEKNLLYCLREGDNVIIATYPNTSITDVFTIERFLEKFPYKVGDKVQHKGATSCGTVYVIEHMKWVNNHIEYDIRPLYDYNHTGLVTLCADDLQPFKEETMDKANKAVLDANAQCCDIMNHLIKEGTMEEQIKIDIPKGYGFVGVDNDNQQVVFEKIGYQYPKTYEECAMH